MGGLQSFLVGLTGGDRRGERLEDLILKVRPVAAPMNDKTRPRIEVGRYVTGMRTLFDTCGLWQRVGSVKRRLVTARTAHVGVYRPPRIKEKRPPELDALLCYRKLCDCHVLGQRLENLFRLLQQRSVVRGGYGKQDGEAGRDARCVKIKPDMSRSTQLESRVSTFPQI
jgi:hypothetical protein